MNVPSAKSLSNHHLKHSFGIPSRQSSHTNIIPDPEFTPALAHIPTEADRDNHLQDHPHRRTVVLHSEDGTVIPHSPHQIVVTIPNPVLENRGLPAAPEPNTNFVNPLGPSYSWCRESGLDRFGPPIVSGEETNK